MASHLLNALGAIALWTAIGCCLLIAAYLLCWFLGREAQRPGMAIYGDVPNLPEGAKARGGNLRPGEVSRATAAPAQVRTGHSHHDGSATNL